MELVVDAIAEAAVEAAVERRRRRWLVGVVLEAMLGATRCTKKRNTLQNDARHCSNRTVFLRDTTL